MKKILYSIIFISLVFPFALNAACDPSDQVELNELSSYVKYSYDFNEKNNTFTLNILNVVEDLLVYYNNSKYSARNNTVTINKITPGSSLDIQIYSNPNSKCGMSTLRNMIINIPYINPYYTSSECKGYEELKICNSQFLDYELSYNSFKQYLLDYNSSKNISSSTSNDNKQDNKFIELLKKYGIPVGLVLITSTIVILIGNAIISRIKTGF